MFCVSGSHSARVVTGHSAYVVASLSGSNGFLLAVLFHLGGPVLCLLGPDDNITDKKSCAMLASQGEVDMAAPILRQRQ